MYKFCLNTCFSSILLSIYFSTLVYSLLKKQTLYDIIYILARHDFGQTFQAEKSFGAASRRALPARLLGSVDFFQ